MLKSLLWKIEFIVRNMSLRSALQYFSITAGACILALGGALVFANHNAGKENGQGGLDTPGIPIVDEEMVDSLSENSNQSAEKNKNYDLSYISYRVRQGDMISVIAENFGITQDTIISINNIRSSRLIQIGQYLKIPTMPGILYTVKQKGETPETIAEKYKVEAVKIAAVNNVETAHSYEAGDTLFVPDAQLDWVTRQEINGDLFKKPIHSRWYRSSRFGWRANPFTGARSYHSGVDMACPTGTYIYAALPGRVTSVGYNATYGNFAIIAHHSGYKTLYGHMSAILCHKGQVVYQTTRIGKVGSTGLSTGPHLHFTVFKNGKQINPENLWN